jgi:uncharacterized protein (DUF885 family)
MESNAFFWCVTIGALCGLLAVFCHGACAATGDPSQQLNALFDREWARDLADDPLLASYRGDSRFNDRWPDLTEHARERRNRLDRAALQTLRSIDRTHLNAGQQLNYELFQRQIEDRLAAFPFRLEAYAMTPRSGVQTISETASLMPFARSGDYQKWLERLKSVPRYVDENIEVLRTAALSERTQPRAIVERVLPQVAMQIVADPTASPFYVPFAGFPPGILQADRERLTSEARRVIQGGIVPAYRRLDQFLRIEYLPHARDSVGIWDTPDGARLYENRILHFTTTRLSADQIHAIGLREVGRLREKMTQVMSEVGFKGSLQEFFTFLRTDPNFYYKDAQDLFSAYVLTAKRIEPELPRLFGKLYRMPFGVRPLPAESAPNTTSAGYDAPSGDGRRAGYFNVNLYRPEIRAKFEVEVLTLHEAVPGHHLQQTIALEQESLPEFRRVAEYNAYVEGWALYAETLGYELGAYQDPYSRFGQLGENIWRAIRLVVDTGIHAKRWTRQRAVQYCRENAPLNDAQIEAEVDRYISWPGQALGYKLGELKILELRGRAETALGPKFDIRSFHDTVLALGPVPLDTLDNAINDWIESQRHLTRAMK